MILWLLKKTSSAHLKSLFYEWYFFSECNSDQLLTFFTHFWVGATAKQHQTHPKVSEKNGQLVRVAFGICKIGTLGEQIILRFMNNQKKHFLRFRTFNY